MVCNVQYRQLLQPGRHEADTRVVSLYRVVRIAPWLPPAGLPLCCDALGEAGRENDEYDGPSA